MTESVSRRHGAGSARRRGRRLVAVWVAATAVFLTGLSPAAAQQPLPELTGDEFNDLFTDADLPNLQEIGPVPSITGNSTVDERIRSVAEGRGYIRRPLAGDGLVWVDGSPMQPEAAAGWKDLKAAAAADGHALRLTSAYRGHDAQRSILLRRLTGYSTSAIDTRLRTAAPPGYSKHHTGYAVDVSSGGSSFRRFADTAVYAWLAADNFRNAKEHGWIPSYPPGASRQGPIPEAWELTYVGLDRIWCWGSDPGPDDPFCDDDASPFEADVEWLAATGVTTGCNPPDNTRFCPAEPVTRGQMAAFLHRALAGRVTPGTAPGPAFTDTPGSVFAADIAWLAATGVTSGCNPPANDRYCPNDPVTRGQMAAFLHRALGQELPAGEPPTAFSDTTTSAFVADIAWLAATGVTSGCNPPANDRYCPNDPVTRGQMAAFLHRALA